MQCTKINVKIKSCIVLSFGVQCLYFCISSMNSSAFLFRFWFFIRKCLLTYFNAWKCTSLHVSKHTEIYTGQQQVTSNGSLKMALFHLHGYNYKCWIIETLESHREAFLCMRIYNLETSFIWYIINKQTQCPPFQTRTEGFLCDSGPTI